MENKLKSLFEFQRFANNPKLAKLIEETEAAYGSELSDDDLFLVSAAGVPEDVNGSLFAKKDEEDK